MSKHVIQFQIFAAFAQEFASFDPVFSRYLSNIHSLNTEKMQEIAEEFAMERLISLISQIA